MVRAYEDAGATWFIESRWDVERDTPERLSQAGAIADLVVGQPMEHAMRTCRLSVTVAQQLGLDAGTVADVHYVALLRFLGCTADAPETAHVAGGDNLAFMAAMLGVVLSDNLISLFVFWELTSITSYLLIGIDDEDSAARAAAGRQRHHRDGGAEVAGDRRVGRASRNPARSGRWPMSCSRTARRCARWPLPRRRRSCACVGLRVACQTPSFVASDDPASASSASSCRVRAPSIRPRTSSDARRR